jgi:8-oxo-dGTP diphosphatase
MSEPEFEIHKAAGIIVDNGKVLLVRAKDEEVYVPPGGKLDPGETAERACVRELEEELSISVEEDALVLLGVYYADAAGSGRKLKMTAYRVTDFRGVIACSHEIAELAEVGATIPEGMHVGSIFAHDIHPLLVRAGELK